jgi:hypothetical protein
MLYKVKLEGAHSGYIIVEWRVNMPRLGETSAMGMEEHNDRGKGVIVVN